MIHQKDDIYVNNLIIRTDYEEDAIKLYTELKVFFKNASINLGEWISNSQKVNDNLQFQNRLKDTVFQVLSIVWNTVIDDIQISMKQINNMQTTATKREVIAATMSTFNPLCWLTASTIMMQIFLLEF